MPVEESARADSGSGSAGQVASKCGILHPHGMPPRTSDPGLHYLSYLPGSMRKLEPASLSRSSLTRLAETR
eukprot:2889028-Rhodomonas_salina.2